jgi:hypothetical protein
MKKTSYEIKNLYVVYFSKNFILDQRKIRLNKDDKFIFFNLNHTERGKVSSEL